MAISLKINTFAGCWLDNSFTMEKLFYIAPDAKDIAVAQEGVICHSGNTGTESVGYRPGGALTDSDFE